MKRRRKPSVTQHGVSPDPILEELQKLKLPATRDNYLWMMFGNELPPEPLDPEIEMQLPPELRSAPYRE